mgnify:CR=1 FL=1
MLYDFTTIEYISTASLDSQNVISTITLIPSNKDGDGATVTMDITTTGNLQGTIDAPEDIITGTLTTA